jgi:signal transduction histidine kinase
MAEAVESLFAVLTAKKREVIELWSQRVKAAMDAEDLARSELLNHIPIFLGELTTALYPEALPLPGIASGSSEDHGSQRLRLGFDVAEIIREYGILHSCIVDVAHDSGVTISPGEHALIAKWVNAAIANAVSQYVAERDTDVERQAAEHLGFLAHELRNPLSAARLAFEWLRKSGLPGGRAVEVLDRNLKRTAELIDSTLTHAWLKLGAPPRLERVVMRRFLDEIEVECGGEAQAKGVAIDVSVEEGLVIEADARLLRSAVSNVLRNAIKFSQPDTKVTLRAQSREARVIIEVADACGGLPPGKSEELFAPLVQRGDDRSGFGLGLAIAQQAVEAHRGTIKVRDLEGRGCVFVISLPSGIPVA